MSEQLSFVDKLYEYEVKEERSLTLLERFIRNLRYLKINTLLCLELRDSESVVEKIDLLIKIAAAIYYILTDRQEGVAVYVKDRQNVTINTYLIFTIDDIYDNVSRIKIPDIISDLSGIVSAVANIEELIEELKNDLQDRKRDIGI